MWRREEMRPWKGLQVWGWSWAATASPCLWRCSGGRMGWRELFSFSLCLVLAPFWGQGVFVHGATAVQEHQTPSQPSPFQPNSNCPPQVPWEIPSLHVPNYPITGLQLLWTNKCIFSPWCLQVEEPKYSNLQTLQPWMAWDEMLSNRGRRSWGETSLSRLHLIEISFNNDFLEWSCQLSSRSKPVRNYSRLIQGGYIFS